MVIIKTFKFNFLFELINICLLTIYKLQKNLLSFSHFLINSSNLFKIQKISIKKNIFKTFDIKYI